MNKQQDNNTNDFSIYDEIEFLTPCVSENESQDEIDAAKVAQWLGREIIFTDESGFENEIVAFTADSAGKRVAYVENRRKDEGKHTIADFHLYVKIDGEIALKWEVETYNPYFGCDVGLLRFMDNEIVMIYREKHFPLICVIGSDSSPNLLAINDYWKVENDVVIFKGEEPGLLERVSIPDLKRLAPIPLWIANNHYIENRSYLVGNRDEFAADLTHRMFGQTSYQFQVDLLIGSLVYRFWDDWPAAQKSYSKCYSSHIRWNSPRWLPYYYYLSGNENERTALLRVLEKAVDYKTEGKKDSIEFAAQYIAQCARRLLTRCKKQKLPDNEYCYFWNDRSQRELKEQLDLFPEGFRSVYQKLAKNW